MTLQTAETLALKALAHLTLAQDDFDRFLAVSGLDPKSLRQRADEPELLAAVLEFLLSQEKLLIDFCETDSIDARDVHMALHVLGRP